MRVLETLSTNLHSRIRICEHCGNPDFYGIGRRKWRETKQQLIWWCDLALIGCCLVSLHFLCDILSGRLVAISLLQNFQELLPLSRHHPPYLFLVFLRRLCWFHFPLLLPPTYIPVVVRRCGHGKRISPSRNVISLVPGKSILCGFLFWQTLLLLRNVPPMVSSFFHPSGWLGDFSHLRITWCSPLFYDATRRRKYSGPMYIYKKYSDMQEKVKAT